MILPETGSQGAVRAAERLRTAVERHKFVDDTVSVAITISVGAATWRASDSREIPDLLVQADAALLEAKRAGRNRVASALPPTARPS